LVPLTAILVRFDDQTGLSASKWGVVPDLDLLASFLHDLHHENDVSGMVPGGLNGRVPVPPEKRFLIHGKDANRFSRGFPQGRPFTGLPARKTVVAFRFRQGYILPKCPPP
jgi:hypothetical protein